MKVYKPQALKVIWNKDLSLSVYPASGGRCMLKTKMFYTDKTWLDTVAPFCEGWFGTADREQWRIRCKVS